MLLRIPNLLLILSIGELIIKVVKKDATKNPPVEKALYLPNIFSVFSSSVDEYSNAISHPDKPERAIDKKTLSSKNASKE
jgi:hypothetical protein